MTLRIWHKGDRVRIQFGEAHADGMVLIASGNGRSLMLSFDAILGGYVGMMAVLAGADDVFRDLITDEPVHLTEIGGSA